MAEGLVLVPDEARIGQLLVAMLAPEAVRMPIGGHGLDHSAHHKLSTLVAARCEEYLEVPLAVLAALELIEDTIREGAEALGATGRGLLLCQDSNGWFINLHEALGVPEVPVRVDNLLCGLKSFIAPATDHSSQRHVDSKGIEYKS